MWTLSGTAATVAKHSVQCVRGLFATCFIVKIAWLERLVSSRRPAGLLTLPAPRHTQLALHLTFHLPVNNPVQFHRVHARPAARQSRSSWDSAQVSAQSITASTTKP